jgi:hypothetical protein
VRKPDIKIEVGEGRGWGRRPLLTTVGPSDALIARVVAAGQPTDDGRDLLRDGQLPQSSADEPQAGQVPRGGSGTQGAAQTQALGGRGGRLGGALQVLNDTGNRRQGDHRRQVLLQGARRRRRLHLLLCETRVLLRRLHPLPPTPSCNHDSYLYTVGFLFLAWLIPSPFSFYRGCSYDLFIYYAFAFLP